MTKKNTIEVFLSEDHGRRTYIWYPNMTEHEFSLWWSDQTDGDIIGYYFNINKLPGVMTPFKERKTIKITEGVMQREDNDPKGYTPAIYAHINDVDDSYIEMNRTRINRRCFNRIWKDQWASRPAPAVQLNKPFIPFR